MGVVKGTSIGQNIALGLTPTQDTFGSAPTTLTNMTDGDVATVTGVGTKSATGLIGRIFLDLGGVVSTLLSAKVGMYASTGNMDAYWIESADGVTWTYAQPITSTTNQSAGTVTYTTEIAKKLTPIVLTSRYVGIAFVSSGAAAPGSVKGYEFKANLIG